MSRKEADHAVSSAFSTKKPVNLKLTGFFFVVVNRTRLVQRAEVVIFDCEFVVLRFFLSGDRNPLVTQKRHIENSQISATTRSVALWLGTRGSDCSS